jgi:hypothetical protein
MDKNHHNSIEGAIPRGSAKIPHSYFRGKDMAMKVTWAIQNSDHPRSESSENSENQYRR